MKKKFSLMLLSMLSTMGTTFSTETDLTGEEPLPSVTPSSSRAAITSPIDGPLSQEQHDELVSGDALVSEGVSDYLWLTDFAFHNSDEKKALLEGSPPFYPPLSEEKSDLCKKFLTRFSQLKDSNKDLCEKFLTRFSELKASNRDLYQEFERRFSYFQRYCQSVIKGEEATATPVSSGTPDWFLIGLVIGVKIGPLTQMGCLDSFKYIIAEQKLSDVPRTPVCGDPSDWRSGFVLGSSDLGRYLQLYYQQLSPTQLQTYHTKTIKTEIGISPAFHAAVEELGRALLELGASNSVQEPIAAPPYNRMTEEPARLPRKHSTSTAEPSLALLASSMPLEDIEGTEEQAAGAADSPHSMVTIANNQTTQAASYQDEDNFWQQAS